MIMRFFIIALFIVGCFVTDMATGSRCDGKWKNGKPSCGGCREPFSDPDNPVCVCYYGSACPRLGNCAQRC
uniref:Uncharacterized protein n=1 Tax=Romanomermis culicivorax TaxID=13658 RepID=A0A915K444_ROMCU